MEALIVLAGSQESILQATEHLGNNNCCISFISDDKCYIKLCRSVAYRFYRWLDQMRKEPVCRAKWIRSEIVSSRALNLWFCWCCAMVRRHDRAWFAGIVLLGSWVMEQGQNTRRSEPGEWTWVWLTAHESSSFLKNGTDLIEETTTRKSWLRSSCWLGAWTDPDPSPSRHRLENWSWIKERRFVPWGEELLPFERNACFSW